MDLNKRSSDVLIAGDFNIDLLKVHEKPAFSNYFDTIISHSFFPKITLPTRFSARNGTLIDNFVFKLSNRLSKSQSGILVNKNHLPYFISVDNIIIKQRNTKQFIQIKKQSPADVLNCKAELSHADFNNRLDQNINSDPNNNYNLLEKTMTDAMNKCMPTKTIKFNKHKHKKTLNNDRHK